MENQQRTIFLVFIFVLSLVALFWQQFTSKKRKVNGIIKEIWIYPIKSTKGIQLTEAEFTSKGFLYDRLFVIVNKNNRFVSQRTHPKLALLETSFNKSTPGYLTLTIPSTGGTGKKSINIPLEEPPTPYEVHTVSIWNDNCEGIDMGNEVAEFINKFLDTNNEMRLMRMPDGYERKTDRKYSNDGQTAFADGFPFLILSEASVETLLQKIPTPSTSSSNSSPLSSLNFRPNLVITQCEAFAEDNWKEIQIWTPTKSSSSSSSSVIPISIVKPCSRCKVPNINPFTGEIPPMTGSKKEEQEPKEEKEENEELYVTNALHSYRTGDILQFYPKGDEGKSPNRWSKSVFFGQNAEPRVKNGILRVGDLIHVEKYQKE